MISEPVSHRPRTGPVRPTGLSQELADVVVSLRALIGMLERRILPEKAPIGKNGAKRKPQTDPR